jgi:hypothetical protein
MPIRRPADLPEGLLTQDAVDAMKRIPFSEIEKDMLSRHGIEIRDALGMLGHREAWEKADASRVKGLDDHAISSLYLTAPDGDAARPAYADFWHWLLDAFEFVPWTETESRRTKSVPILKGMVMPERAPNELELAKARKRLEAGGQPLPEEAWLHFARNACDAPKRSESAERIVDMIVEDNGGPVVIEMTVDC